MDVFVAEANDGHAELVESSLREGGYVNRLNRLRNWPETYAVVSEISTGFSVKNSSPPLLLLDYNLPQGGGVRMLREFRRNLRHSWMPVIIMATVGQARQAEECRKLGCEAYFTKWTVFLGLPVFVNKIRGIAARTIRNCG